MDEDEFKSVAEDVLLENLGDFLDFQEQKISLQALIERVAAKKGEMVSEDAERLQERVLEKLRAARP